MLEVTLVVLAVFLLTLMCFMVRAATVWDRLILLNLITLKLAMMMVVYAVLKRSGAMLDVALTYSLIGFLSVSMLSRFILKGGRLK